MAGLGQSLDGASPKLRMDRSITWDHHRDGWGYMERLIRDHFGCADGVLFVSAVEDQLVYHGALLEPWVGVVHQVPHHDLPRFPDLARLVELEAWRQSAPHCRGLWTLCEYTQQFLVERRVSVPVGVLPYASPRDVPLFDLDRFKARERPLLLHVGEFLRNYQAFFDLDVPGWHKQMLEPSDWPTRSRTVRQNATVEVIAPVADGDYDALLRESVVFLHLVDAPANTTVVECLARATPLCVNKVGGVGEYLGADYPLYHEGGNAASLLRDWGRISETHAYLLDRRDRVAGPEQFLRAACSSSIYRALPLPASQSQGGGL